MRINMRIAALLFVAAAMLTPRVGETLPVFARRYQTSCTTCHAPVPPKVNNFGEAFKNNGFRMPSDDEFFVKKPDQELGASAWKQVWPGTVWPGAIPSEVPLALKFEFAAQIAPPGAASAGHHGAPALEPEERGDAANEVEGEEHAEQDAGRRLVFEYPSEVAFMSAGTAGTHVSWWGMVHLDNDAALTIHEAWAQIDNILDESLLNVRLGRFEPRLHPLSSIRKYTATNYLTAEFRPTFGTETRQNLLMPQAGIELWGVRSIKSTGGGLEYAVGLLNGGGPTAAGEANAAKDFYGRVAYKFGGMGVGRSLEDSYKLEATGNWIDNSLRVGAFGYRGRWGEQEWPFSRLGADLNAWVETVNVYGVFVTGNDEGPRIDGSSGDIDFIAWTAGADWVAWPWLVATFRVEGSRQDAPDGGAEKTRVRFVPALTVGLRPNVVLQAEAVLHTDEGDEGPADLGLANFTIAF